MAHTGLTFVSSAITSQLAPPTSASLSGATSSPPRRFFKPTLHRLPWPIRSSNLVPPPEPASKPSTDHSILWFRLGFFRLADNPAVAAALLSDTLLPVATVQRTHLSPRVIYALKALKNQLLHLGSNLIVRVVQNSAGHEVEAVRNIAAGIRARTLFLNVHPSSPELIAPLRSGGFKVNAFHAPSSRIESFVFSPEPSRTPPLPSRAHDMHSDCRFFVGPAMGERTARSRLTTILRQGWTRDSPVYRLFETEVRIGCLARERIAFEMQRHRMGGEPYVPHGARFSGITQRMRAFFTRRLASPSMAALGIAAYDVNEGDRRGVKWDDSTKSFVLQEWEHTETERRMNPRERVNEFIRRRRNFLMRSFFPEDVTPDYYSFTAWRFAQRCVSSTIGVFGTSSLLFALGIRSGRIGQAAVISWVLKEGLGRVGKMIWAGSMGKDFDVDPKRWRFRSALLYAGGSGLEIVTQIFPASFLVFATAANSMKQVSMLTSSACRNAMYRSFGERSQNIANITAKGEAQIVVADLIGMGTGIQLSKLIGSSRPNVITAFLALTTLDIFGIYMELRSVIFRSLNAERASVIIPRLVNKGKYMTPSQVSPKEAIFLPPRYTRFVRMTSIAKAAKDPAELNMLLRVFRKEHFLVSTPRAAGGGPCRLVLRNDASNEDVLRAMLLIGYVQKARKAYGKKPMTLDEQECVLRNAASASKRSFPSFLKGLRQAGWTTDNLLFGTMKRRGYWRREVS